MSEQYGIGIEAMGREQLAVLASMGFSVMNSENTLRDRDAMDQQVIAWLKSTAPKNIQHIIDEIDDEVLRAISAIFAAKADAVMAVPM